MGFTTGGPRGVGVITSPFTPSADMGEILAVLAERGGYLGGVTEAERDAITGAALFEGLSVYNTDRDTIDVHDGSGWVEIARRPIHFGYVKTNSFFWQTSETDHTWNASPSEGTLAGFSTTDQITFTCTVPGWYLVQGAITADTGTSPLNLSFFKNGTAFRIFNSVAHSAAYTTVPFNVSTRFSVGNTFKVRIQGTSSSTAGVPGSGAQTFFTVDRIGA